jgi:hypothetical protein
MSTLPKALRLADALDELDRQFSRNGLCGDAAAELRRLHEALETEQEPVAWITDGGKGELWWYQSSKFDEEGNLIGPNPDDIPLYTAPPQREWVGLTDQEINSVCYKRDWTAPWTDTTFSRAIEAKLKEKNHG